MEDKTIGIIKMAVGTVLGAGVLVIVARYNAQLGSFLNAGATSLVTLGNGVANFGGGGASLQG